MLQVANEKMPRIVRAHAHRKKRSKSNIFQNVIMLSVMKSLDQIKPHGMDRYGYMRLHHFHTITIINSHHRCRCRRRLSLCVFNAKCETCEYHENKTWNQNPFIKYISNSRAHTHTSDLQYVIWRNFFCWRFILCIYKAHKFIAANTHTHTDMCGFVWAISFFPYGENAGEFVAVSIGIMVFRLMLTRNIFVASV